MEATKKLDKKINIIFTGIISFIVIIIFRLLYLQIHQTERFFVLSKKNFTRIQKIVSPRGNIVDTNNHLLVTNRPIINIYWHGTGNRVLDPEQIQLIQRLEVLLDKNLSKDLDLLKYTERYSKRNLITTDISFETLSKIVEYFPDTQNIAITTKFKRFYPHQSLASHIVGYLGQINLEEIGKMGLEQLFQDELKGKPGESIATINSFGKSLHTSQTKPAVPGKTIRTTIDLHIQKIAEKIFPSQYKGAFIIMDPETGGLKALLSKPDFDPTIFLKQLSAKEWAESQEKKPFLNRAFNACYPPASIFKLVTISAALELGLVNKDSTWFCNGYINFVNRKYHCANKQGHGLMTTNEAVVNSCNPFFYNIARNLKIDDLADYARRFGLGEKTGIIFAEKPGLIPTNAWKLKKYGESWWPGETLSAVIGQSYLSVTPIQIARMISGIFKGYLVTPKILEEEKTEKKPLNIKRETLEFLRQAMKMVTTDGTGRRVNKIRDITIYAKTGTAQTSALEKRDMGNEYLEHAWFVANFAYKDQKPFTMVIFLENAGSASIAVAAAREFLIEYRNMLEVALAPNPVILNATQTNPAPI